ncbi:hypothetical protein [Streptomyces sp. NPDC055099]
MVATSGQRRQGNGRQLLLLAALLFGIVTMHTLGHPTAHSSSPAKGHSTGATSPASGHSTGATSPASGHSTGATSPASGHSTSATSPASGHSPHQPSHPSGTEQAAAQHEMSASDPAPPGMAEVTGHARVATAVGAPTGMDGMDPLSVCLAVLAAFTLVLLLKAGLLRPGGFVVPARPLARLLDGLRPNPPPPRILLSHLSVLRI